MEDFFTLTEQIDSNVHVSFRTAREEQIKFGRASCIDRVDSSQLNIDELRCLYAATR